MNNSNVANDKYLSFCLGAEEYAIQILKVQEIIGMIPVTMVPKVPDYVRGVINLRGKIIAVVDLRRKFGMEPREPTSETCVVVVRTHGVEVGAIVDRVLEVLNVAPSDLEPPPDFGTHIDTSFLLGIGKHQGRARLLLDIDRVLSSTGLVHIKDTIAAE